jgi:hypothetical protein
VPDRRGSGNGGSSPRSSPRRKPTQVADPRGGAGKPSWVCLSCTYEHVDAEADFLQCKMCSSLRTLPSAVAAAAAIKPQQPRSAVAAAQPAVAAASPVLSRGQHQPLHQRPPPKPKPPPPPLSSVPVSQPQSVHEIMMQQWRKAIAGETSPVTSPTPPSDTLVGEKGVGHKGSSGAGGKPQQGPPRPSEKARGADVESTAAGAAQSRAVSNAAGHSGGGGGGVNISVQGRSQQAPLSSAALASGLAQPALPTPDYPTLPAAQPGEVSSVGDAPKPPPRRRRSSSTISSASPPSGPAADVPAGPAADVPADPLA